MRVEITSVHQDTTGAVRALFRSTAGTAEGVWFGPAPEVGAQYDVELEVPGTFTWGQTLHPCVGCDDTITGSLGRVTIQGRLEALEEDGTAVIRVHEAVLLLDTEGRAALGAARVRVDAAVVELHDTNM